MDCGLGNTVCAHIMYVIEGQRTDGLIQNLEFFKKEGNKKKGRAVGVGGWLVHYIMSSLTH